MQEAVERVIQEMWDHYDEPLPLEKMADVALFSRFYFSRVFRSVTGTSPGRFLTAVRLAKAKDLLLETERSVTDVSYAVGYNSPGTFSSRFTRSVGVSPARFRFLATAGITAPSYPRCTGSSLGSVGGSLRMPDSDAHSRSYIGIFDTMIPEGFPIACNIMDGEGAYLLSGIPEGSWFMHTVVVSLDHSKGEPRCRRPLFVDPGRQVRIAAGRTSFAQINTRHARLTDPPVLLALPELVNRPQRVFATASAGVSALVGA
jgi:AraC family transcriptional regulator